METIPERFGIFTGDGLGSGTNWSRSSSHRCGDGGKQANPGNAKSLRGNKSSGMLCFSNSGNVYKSSHLVCRVKKSDIKVDRLPHIYR